MNPRLPTRSGRYALAGGSLAACLLVAGCLFEDEPRHVGRTVETTNGITARIVLPNSTPARHIKVFILDEKGWLENVKAGESVYADSGSTDSTGKFFIKRADSLGVTLLVNVEDYGILIPNVTQNLLNHGYRGQITLRRLVSYQGKIKDSTGIPKQVLLAGTPYSGDCDPATGAFTISKVPPEVYPVLVRRELPDRSEDFQVAGEVDLEQGDVIVPDPIVPDTATGMLIEDFEDQDNRNKLGQVLGGGFWDAINDFTAGGTAELRKPVDAAPTNFEAAIGGADSLLGRSLEVQYEPGTPGPGQPYSFVFLDCNLGASYKHYNLSGFDTLTFWAKGSGQILVELHQNMATVPIHVIASAEITLAEGWQKFKITPEQLSVVTSVFPENPTQYHGALREERLPAYTERVSTWEAMGGMVRTIRFVAHGGTGFWIDNLGIQGVDVGDLVK